MRPYYDYGKEEALILLTSAMKVYAQGLRDLCQRCCAFDPGERPGSQVLKAKKSMEGGDKGLNSREVGMMKKIWE